MPIDRVNFSPIAQGGDNVTAALVKLDSNCEELATSIDGDGTPDNQGLIGRIDAAEDEIESINGTLNGLGTAATKDVGTTADTVAAGDDVRFNVKGIFPQGYISGLLFARGSTSQVIVYPGSCYIPSLGRVIENTVNLTTPAASLAANTFYYIYAYQNAGAFAVELSTTSPSAYTPINYTKTGDNSRRLIGYVLTDSAGSIIDHWCPREGVVRYLSPFGGMRALANGLSLSATNVTISQFIPSIARAVCLSMLNNGSPAVGNVQTNVYPLAQVIYEEFPITTPALIYKMSGATNPAGLYIDIIGCTFSR